MDIEFKARLKLLREGSSSDKVVELNNISTMFIGEQTSPLLSVVQTTDFVKILAQIILDHKQWTFSHPKCISDIINTIYNFMQWNIPMDQTKALVDSLQLMLFSQDHELPLFMLAFIAVPDRNKLLLLHNSALYSIYHHKVKQLCLKGDLRLPAIRMFQSCVVDSLEWQAKILDDRQFIVDLLVPPILPVLWVILSTVALHPDAKILFPVSEVLSRASKDDFCYSICAVLCSETDVTSLKLDTTYVEGRMTLLETMLDVQDHVSKRVTGSLLAIVIPFVNLSVGDKNKDILGQYLIVPLLRVLAIQDNKPLHPKISKNLARSKQETAKILWNLAFVELNRKRIADAGGLGVLKSIFEHTTDKLLKRNIEGVLYMFTPHNPSAPPHTPSTKVRHVMISYSWFYQPTVLRMASSLKDHGYKVWLDKEQIEGSTLAAMAEAIEEAELFLMCYSQKYKDSPNCKLEGEYCITRKVDYIPIMMQRNYLPDGWLGLAIGAKLNHDFSSEDNWDEKIAALVKEMAHRGKAVRSTALTSARMLSSSNLKKSVESWTPQDMLEWMKEAGIAQHYDTFKKHEVTGKGLLELKALLLSPQNAQSYLQMLNITALGQILNITAAIRKL